MNSGEWQAVLSRTAAPLHQKTSVQVVQTSAKGASRTPPFRGFPDTFQRRPRGRPRISCRSVCREGRLRLPRLACSNRDPDEQLKMDRYWKFSGQFN